MILFGFSVAQGMDAVAVNDGQLDRLYVDTGSGADLTQSAEIDRGCSTGF